MKISTKDNETKANLFKKNPLLFPVFLFLSITEIERSGYFEINIRHTARSWGNDIETLLSNQIDSILLKTGWLKDKFNKNKIIFLLILVGGLSSAGIYSLNTRNAAYWKNCQQTIGIILKNPSVSNKINYLINLTTYDHTDFLSEQYGSCYVVIILFSFLFAVIIMPLFTFKEESFIVLTRESLKHKNSILQHEKNEVLIFIISYTLSIVASIIASCIYAHFTK